MDVTEARVSFAGLQAKDTNSELSATVSLPSMSSVCVSTEDVSGNFQPIKIQFTRLREALLFVLVIFYVGDVGLDIWVAVNFFKSGHPMTGWFITFCILLPNLYAGFKSLQWYLLAHDYDPIRRPLPWMIRVVFFPCSLLLRYFDTYMFGIGSRIARNEMDRKTETRLFSLYLMESAEVSMLRLFIIFLEDAPIAVINLRVVIMTPPEVQKKAMEMVLVVIAKLVLTMTVGVLHFIISTKAVYHAARVEQDYLLGNQWVHRIRREDWEERGFLSWPAEFCVYLWHFCGIGSRLVAYALFIAVHQRHIWILVGLRWLINIIWIKYDSPQISFSNCVAFGGVYLFSFVPISSKNQLLRVLVFYAFTFTENIVIAVLFSIGLPHNDYTSGAFGIVFGGAVLGMFFMCIYYGYLHPGKKHMRLQLRSRPPAS